MNLRLIFFTLTALVAISLYIPQVQSVYRHKIVPFSFDIRKHEYPLEYWKVGATVALKDTIKLLPKVEARYGGIWLSQPVETSQFEMVYRMDIKNDKNTIYKK